MSQLQEVEVSQEGITQQVRTRGFLCQRYIVKVQPYFETHRMYDWHSFLQVVEGAQILTEEQAEQLLRLQHQEQPEEPQEILQEVQEVRLTLFLIFFHESLTCHIYMPE